MRRWTPLAFCLLLSCGTDTVDLPSPPDASLDGIVGDTSAADVQADSPTAGDSGPGGDGGLSDGATDDASDGSIDLDGGAPDGSLCPPCLVSQTCCTVAKSANYGKCYAKACLACCM